MDQSVTIDELPRHATDRNVVSKIFSRVYQELDLVEHGYQERQLSMGAKFREKIFGVGRF